MLRSFINLLTLGGVIFMAFDKAKSDAEIEKIKAKVKDGATKTEVNDIVTQAVTAATAPYAERVDTLEDAITKIETALADDDTEAAQAAIDATKTDGSTTGDTTGSTGETDTSGNAA